jgi:hypothetical protein
MKYKLNTLAAVTATVTALVLPGTALADTPPPTPSPVPTTHGTVTPCLTGNAPAADPGGTPVPPICGKCNDHGGSRSAGKGPAASSAHEIGCSGPNEPEGQRAP